MEQCVGEVQKDDVGEGSAGVCVWFGVFFFFKQKTAYEIGTGDWSSDVCSSDLSERTELKKRQLDIEERKVAAQEKQLELLMLLVKDRKSVVQGKSVDLGGRRIIKKKKTTALQFYHTHSQVHHIYHF